MRIVINGTAVDFAESHIGYDRVVELANQKGTPSVIYKGPRKGDSHRQGIMDPGSKPVEVEDGMRFEVCHTGNA